MHLTPLRNKLERKAFGMATLRQKIYPSLCSWRRRSAQTNRDQEKLDDRGLRSRERTQHHNMMPCKLLFALHQPICFTKYYVYRCCRACIDGEERQVMPPDATQTFAVVTAVRTFSCCDRVTL